MNLKQVFLFTILGAMLSSDGFSQGAFDEGSGNEHTLSVGLETGLVINFADRAESKNNTVHGWTTANLYPAVKAVYKRNHISFMFSYAKMSYTVSAQGKDNEIKTGFASRFVSDQANYNRIIFCISREYSIGNRMTINPLIGIAFLTSRYTGFTGRSTGSGITTSPTDTIYDEHSLTNYRLQKSVIAPHIGFSFNYQRKKWTGSLTASYYRSFADWNQTDVRFYRSSARYGTLEDSGTVYSKASTLNFGFSIAYDLFTNVRSKSVVE